MAQESYTRHSRFDKHQQIGAIVRLDVTAGTAAAMLRDGSEITVALIFPVGGSRVTPALGEQWLLEKQQGTWQLEHRMPFNTPVESIPRTQGQHVVGSGTGPVELAGTSVVAHGPIMLKTHETASRPDAATVGAGATIFDTTLGYPIFSNGVNWINAAGTPV